MTDPLRQGLTTDIKERGSLDSYPYLSPWSFQHSTGSQLIILDPVRTRHTGNYVCQALPIDNGRDQIQLEPLHAEIFVNILVGKFSEIKEPHFCGILFAIPLLRSHFYSCNMN